MQQLRSESKTGFHRILDKKVKVAHWTLLVKKQMVSLEVDRIRINKARAPPLQFNWSDAAKSAEPTKEIHISEAPPVPRTAIEAIAHRYF